MISEYEAQKLKHNLKHELEGRSGAVWKSALGLAAVLVLTLVGTELDSGPDSSLGGPPVAVREAVSQQPTAITSHAEDRLPESTHVDFARRAE